MNKAGGYAGNTFYFSETEGGHSNSLFTCQQGLPQSRKTALPKYIKSLLQQQGGTETSVQRKDSLTHLSNSNQDCTLPAEDPFLHLI